nr:protein kinase [Streptomyces exfoliatus]
MSVARPGGRVQPSRPGDPQRVGPYRIIGRLGSGGMGTVHAGLDAAGSRVAVKVVHPAQADDPEFRARFRREVQLSARVQGPCLIPLLAADPDADTPWLATAFTPGLTLDQHLAVHGPLIGATLIAFAAGTAQALATIHAAGVVHRDVKPQNVILAAGGPRVLDFGIAHATDGTSVTRTGVMTGTPGWVSPEHYRTGAAGPEGDVFTWGALVAYAATGRLPFGTGAPDVIAYRVMSDEPDLQSLPDALQKIVGRALAKTPVDRPTASGIAGECIGLLAAQTTLVVSPATNPTLAADLVATQWGVPTPEEPAWHPPVRSRKRVLGVSLAVGAVIGGLVGAAISLQSDGDSTQRSNALPPRGGTSATALADTPATPSQAADPTASERPTPSSADTDEATIAAWHAARRPKGEAELETSAALYHDVSLGVGPDYGYDGQYDIRFAEPRREIYIAVNGPALTPHIIQSIAKDACYSLRMMADMYKELPYDEYVLVDETTPTAPAIVWEDDFRTNTGCVTQAVERNTAGTGQESDWQPTEGGLEAARIPSTDEEEIRVATEAVHELFIEWNGNSRLVHSPRYLSDENTSIGFAPHEKVMYVWTTKPEWNQSTRQEWAEQAATVACRAVLTESRARQEWIFYLYAVAVLDDDGEAQFLRWGSAGSCDT